MTNQCVAIIIIKIKQMFQADQLYYVSLQDAQKDYEIIKNAMLIKEVIEVIYENIRMTINGEDVSFISFTSLANISRSDLQ